MASESYPDPKDIFQKYTQNHYIPYYFRPWWLDGMCGPANWGVALSLDKGLEVKAVWVYYLKKKWGFTILTNPPLSAYSGPWLEYPANLFSEARRRAFEKKVAGELALHLPKSTFCLQEWHPCLKNALPYKWLGFQQTTQYTYQLALDRPMEQVFSQFESATRNHIRKAQNTFQVIQSEDIEQMYRLNNRSFQRKQATSPYRQEYFLKAYALLQHHLSVRIFFATNAEGHPSAGLLMAHDEKTAYFLSSGLALTEQDRGCLYLLIWQALQYAAGKVKAFDFEGSMVQEIECVFRSFGGELVPHHKVFKAENKLWSLLGNLYLGAW